MAPQARLGDLSWVGSGAWIWVKGHTGRAGNDLADLRTCLAEIEKDRLGRALDQIRPLEVAG